MNKLKIQSESKQIETINQLEEHVHKQKFTHCPNYHRIKQQVNDLIIQPPDNFKVTVFEQTKVRIVLRIFYFIPKWEIEAQNVFQVRPSKSMQEKGFSQKFNKIQNIFMEVDEYVQQKANEFEDYSIGQKYVLFTCIIDYDVYPFSPPYLIITENNQIPINLTINDFSNIVDEIISKSEWFPSYTLQDILKHIPELVQNLNEDNFVIKSSYYYENPFRKLDIHQHALGLKIYEGQFYDTKEVFLGKYVKKVIGISFKSLIIFKKNDMNGLKISDMFPIAQVDKVTINQNEKRIKFILTFKGKKQISYKVQQFEQSRIGPQHIENRNYFINWMKLCLFNAMYENFKKKQSISMQAQTNLKQNLNRKSSKINNQQNQNSIYDFTKGLQERDSNERKHSLQQSIIQKQQHLLGILQTVDLILSASVYRPYQTNDLEQINETISMEVKGKNVECTNSKLKPESNKKSVEKQRLDQVDLTKNEYFKLKNYKQNIEYELKKLFTLI